MVLLPSRSSTSTSMGTPHCRIGNNHRAQEGCSFVEHDHGSSPGVVSDFECSQFLCCNTFFFSWGKQIHRFFPKPPVSVNVALMSQVIRNIRIFPVAISRTWTPPFCAWHVSKCMISLATNTRIKTVYEARFVSAVLLWFLRTSKLWEESHTSRTRHIIPGTCYGNADGIWPQL